MHPLALLCASALLGCALAAGAAASPGRCSEDRATGFAGAARCVNAWDEGCVNGQLPGAGRDEDFVNGEFNPGKRCVHMWDSECTDGPTNGAGNVNDLKAYGRLPARYPYWAKLLKNAQH